MIQHVDRALEQLLRRLGLDDTSVDISFDAPDRSWGASRVRPCVNVFLWQVVRNPSYRRAGMEQRVDNGVTVARRPATPYIDLHYLVTAWAADQRDEHQILGSILAGLLATPRLPDEVLPEPLQGTRCGIGLAPYDKHVPGEFWSALGGQLKPGLQLEINLPLDVFAWVDVAPPVVSIGAAVGRIAAAPGPEPTDEPVLRRHRAGGALVMEGRRVEGDEGDEPGGRGGA